MPVPPDATVTLSFRHWVELFDNVHYPSAHVEVSVDGGAFTNVRSYHGAWESQATLDLPDIVASAEGSEVEFRKLDLTPINALTD